MRELIAEFASLQPRPDISTGDVLLLGREDRRPELRDVYNDVQVIFVDPGNLRAVGVVVSRSYPDGRYWFGVVQSETEDLSAH